MSPAEPFPVCLGTQRRRCHVSEWHHIGLPGQALGLIELLSLSKGGVSPMAVVARWLRVRWLRRWETSVTLCIPFAAGMPIPESAPRADGRAIWEQRFQIQYTILRFANIELQDSLP